MELASRFINVNEGVNYFRDNSVIFFGEFIIDEDVCELDVELREILDEEV